MAFQVGANQCVASPGAWSQRDIAFGYGAGIAGRQHQQLDAFALVDSEKSGVLLWLLPDVDDVGVERAVRARRRDVEHDRPRALGVEERHEIKRVGIGRESLVLPV